MMNSLKTSRFKWIGFLLLLVGYLPAYAFNTVDEQIDHYLSLIDRGGYKQNIDMLKQLQWSGISDSRLYDEIEKQVLSRYLGKDLDKFQIGLASHHLRALGYSGNDKYRVTLTEVKDKSVQRKLRNHAKKALVDLDRWALWNMKIELSDYPVEGKEVEIGTYMKMISVDDPLVQRLGLQAVYHQQLRDPDLLALIAQKIEDLYALPGLDAQSQDTVAWMCRALGQNGGIEYVDLLTRVATNTPHKKIRKHAQKYAR